MSYKGGKQSNVYNSEEGYDLRACKYDKKEGFLNSFESDKFWRMAGEPQGRILDLGCGTGRMIKSLSHDGNEIIGVDVSEKMLEKAQKNSQLQNL